MFRSSTIIRDPALNLAKVIFMLKHSVKLRRYLTECFNINITFSQVQCKLPDDGRRAKHVGAIFVSFNVFLMCFF